MAVLIVGSSILKNDYLKQGVTPEVDDIEDAFVGLPTEIIVTVSLPVAVQLLEMLMSVVVEVSTELEVVVEADLLDVVVEVGLPVDVELAEEVN